MTPSAVRRRNRCTGPCPGPRAGSRAPRPARPPRRSRPPGASRRPCRRPRSARRPVVAVAAQRGRTGVQTRYSQPDHGEHAPGREPGNQHDRQGGCQDAGDREGDVVEREHPAPEPVGDRSPGRWCRRDLAHGYVSPSANDDEQDRGPESTRAPPSRHATPPTAKARRRCGLRHPVSNHPTVTMPGDDARAARGDDAPVGRRRPPGTRCLNTTTDSTVTTPEQELVVRRPRRSAPSAAGVAASRRAPARQLAAAAGPSSAGRAPRRRGDGDRRSCAIRVASHAATGHRTATAASRPRVPVGARDLGRQHQSHERDDGRPTRPPASCRPAGPRRGPGQRHDRSRGGQVEAVQRGPPAWARTGPSTRPVRPPGSPRARTRPDQRRPRPGSRRRDHRSISTPANGPTNENGMTSDGEGLGHAGGRALCVRGAGTRAGRSGTPGRPRRRTG